MSLQSMPLFDFAQQTARINPAVMRDSAAHSSGGPIPVLSGAVKFDAQVAAELITNGNEARYSLSRAIGSYRMPYPNIWLEWKEDGRRYGVWMVENCLQDGFSIRVLLFTREAKVLMTSPGIETIVTDTAGGFEAVYDKCLDCIEKRDIGESGWSEGVDLRSERECYRSRDDRWSRGLLTAYLALGLINCKNVKIGDVRAGNPRSNKPAERKKARKVSYHTIILPGMTGDGSTSSAESRDIIALHRVRGHFKTYTADAPLLGKHTGTYWWGWQVRGNKANGVSVTDYKIGATS